MIEETPTKVMGFLGTALMSMAFLFAVTATNASFSGTEQSLPDPFNPQHVVAILDSTANGYSSFLSAYLFQPAQNDLAYFTDSVKADSAWVLDNIDNRVVAMAGLSDLVTLPPTPQAHPAGHVAGAYTMHASP